MNSGGPYQPNTKYTFTVEVSDRFAIAPNDVIGFPGAVEASLLEDVNELTGETLAFTPPANGNTSTLKLEYTTGASAPAGAIGFVLRASGVSSQPGVAATQVVFDNVKLDATAAPPPSAVWTGGASANWDDAGNWDIGAKPTGTTPATFPAPVPGGFGATITLAGGELAKSLSFDDNYTLTAGSLATPAVDVAAGKVVTIASMLNGTGGLLKSGAGTLTLSGGNAHSDGTTVSAGTLVLGNADATAGGAIDVADGALVQAQAVLPKAVTVTTLATHTSGKFDLTSNSMVVKGMTAPQVRALLQSGYNAGHWDGAMGIVSSTAAASTETSIGYASNASLNLTQFKGVTGLTTNDVLVKYTYAGDANLDGKVDIGDLGLLAGAWQQSGKVWFDGDFTYNGTVDIGDLGLLAGNWQKGVDSGPLLVSFDQAMAQFAAFDGVVVPEPASLCLLALGGPALCRRRRRVRQS